LFTPFSPRKGSLKETLLFSERRRCGASAEIGVSENEREHVDKQGVCMEVWRMAKMLEEVLVQELDVL